ncbi:uncharacterized protein A1O9_05315 [Exophiala aquamarina CBS 119918]|uniref:Gluconate 5-dehydrogenase n=1 Tax=Exophiala aquamarina CBS 119918 TaxID=1182545 RepID=A0A072PDN3_9EURO|nr:uncharacterized protein A1O9_05315 [Exophiala aquamarina CBS 119918]KEF57398.1 hypothetical protein A1O9_05315 [Exophiala aquamarina CBS 119918]
MDQFVLSDRNILITGGNQGIGLGLAAGLARLGANLIIFDISPPSAEFEQISKSYGVRTAYRKVDVSSVSALRKSFEDTVKPFCGDGGLDICIAAAGINQLKDFRKIEEGDFDQVVNVNVKGVYFTCQQAAEAMIGPESDCKARTGGKASKSIILIASTAAQVATRTHNSSVYALSKSAVRGMVPELAKELGPHGIRVNSISPGYTLTNMTAGYPDLVKQWQNDTMLGTIGTPEDYVGAAVYLASSASRYVTGQDFLIDGGSTKW